jgi:hypothetical protein
MKGPAIPLGQDHVALAVASLNSQLCVNSALTMTSTREWAQKPLQSLKQNHTKAFVLYEFTMWENWWERSTVCAEDLNRLLGVM